MNARRARKLLKEMELESYIDVIHTIAIEDWTHPYRGDAIEAEKAATATSAREFLQKMGEYRDSLFAFHELSQLPHIYIERKGVDIPDLIPILDQYLLHLTQLSELESPPDAQNSITWATWLIDYINYREWGQSRTNLINLIYDQK